MCIIERRRNKHMIEGNTFSTSMKAGVAAREIEGMGFYVAFNSLGHIATVETRNQEEIPFPSQIAPRGLSVAEGP